MAANTNRSGWRRPRTNRGGASHLPGWFIPVVTVVIAIAAAWVMETMQEQALEDRAAQLVFAQFEEGAAQAHVIASEMLDEG